MGIVVLDYVALKGAARLVSFAAVWTDEKSTTLIEMGLGDVGPGRVSARQAWWGGPVALASLTSSSRAAGEARGRSP